MAKQTFESAMKQLEKIVDTLENDSISLDKALKKFEEGITLAKFCEDTLDETEKKMRILMESADGSISESAFDPNDEG